MVWSGCIASQISVCEELHSSELQHLPLRVWLVNSCLKSRPRRRRCARAEQISWRCRYSAFHSEPILRKKPESIFFRRDGQSTARLPIHHPPFAIHASRESVPCPRWPASNLHRRVDHLSQEGHQQLCRGSVSDSCTEPRRESLEKRVLVNAHQNECDLQRTQVFSRTD